MHPATICISGTQYSWKLKCKRLGKGKGKGKQDKGFVLISKYSVDLQWLIPIWVAKQL